MGKGDGVFDWYSFSRFLSLSEHYKHIVFSGHFWYPAFEWNDFHDSHPALFPHFFEVLVYKYVQVLLSISCKHILIETFWIMQSWAEDTSGFRDVHSAPLSGICMDLLQVKVSNVMRCIWLVCLVWLVLQLCWQFQDWHSDWCHSDVCFQLKWLQLACN